MSNVLILTSLICLILTSCRHHDKELDPPVTPQGELAGDLFMKGCYISGKYFDGQAYHYPPDQEAIQLTVSATSNGIATFQYEQNGVLLRENMVFKEFIPDGLNSYFSPYPDYTTFHFTDLNNDNIEIFWAFPTNVDHGFAADSVICFWDPLVRGLLYFYKAE